MLSRSPCSNARNRFGCVARLTALSAAVSARVARPLITASDARSGSVSTIARSNSAGEFVCTRAGCCPVRRTYSSAPSAYTSVAVVSTPPVSCSGAAYSGDQAAAPLGVTVAGVPRPSPSNSFAIPKSSSFTCPCFATSTFDGFRSRWTIRFACACATAASTWRNSCSRASIDNRFASQ